MRFRIDDDFVDIKSKSDVLYVASRYLGPTRNKAPFLWLWFAKAVIRSQERQVEREPADFLNVNKLLLVYFRNEDLGNVIEECQRLDSSFRKSNALGSFACKFFARGDTEAAKLCLELQLQAQKNRFAGRQDEYEAYVKLGSDRMDKGLGSREHFDFKSNQTPLESETDMQKYMDSCSIRKSKIALSIVEWTEQNCKNNYTQSHRLAEIRRSKIPTQKLFDYRFARELGMLDDTFIQYASQANTL